MEEMINKWVNIQEAKRKLTKYSNRKTNLFQLQGKGISVGIL